MKYHFLNYLDLGSPTTEIRIITKTEYTLESLKKNKSILRSWFYSNIFVNGVKKKSLELYSKGIVEGVILVGDRKFFVRDSVFINPSSLVADVNKTRGNWENWWSKVRKKSDVDLYDQLWVESERKLNGEPSYVESDFTDKVVLDAGCGNGRYLPLFHSFGSTQIIAVDLGKQVYLAQKQHGHMPNIHFVQSDLMSLPFKKNCLDTVASHGVLHHTPNPFKTFKYLSSFLKIGGTQAVYVYHKEWWHFSAHKKSYFLDVVYDLGVAIWQSIRKVISRMPHFVIIAFCYMLAVKGTVDQYLMKHSNPFLNILGKCSFSIPPICYLGVNFHERVVRNYDHYSATFNYFQTIDEVVDWFRRAGFNDLEVASIPVSIRGKKSSSENSVLRIKQHKFISHFEFRAMWEKMYKN